MSVGSIGDTVNPVLIADSGDQSVGSVADRFERAMGSRFLVLFAPALFDEMMLPAVSASLVDTARSETTRLPVGVARPHPFNSRSSPTTSIVAKRCNDSVRLHRDIKGVGPRRSSLQRDESRAVELEPDQHLLHAPRGLHGDHRRKAQRR